MIGITEEKVEDELRAAVAERAPHVRMEDVHSTNESGDLAIESSAAATLKLLQACL